MSVTYHKKTKKRKRTHGFRKRMKTSGGKRTLSRRRSKKRWKLTV
ncbi:MAG: 50S ribosomal protein L34 [Candidatus Nealsonbacteria bacterium CG02_land_8_20_14_3_00_37_10]|uniref:Large ribosomal subunit protein bL34 n=1 Tax=Candidatus Nealsonbacteria bacterium CG02_land_8_20_14_3_00_37_10 TaxID=1974699 RepID=A0A2M7DA86_9BACT|nr:MAG: 50S ribosomal protein L34 [Candidatus Nealsonbacteria bacterium CG02_land_8_20_14_3_00_37_10]